MLDQLEQTSAAVAGPPPAGVWSNTNLNDIFTPAETRDPHPFEPWYGNLNKITSVPFRTPVDPVLYVDVPVPDNLDKKGRAAFEEKRAILSRRLSLCAKIGRSQLIAPCNNFTFNLCKWNRELTMLGGILEPYGGLDPNNEFEVHPIALEIEDRYLTEDDLAEIDAGLPRIFGPSDVEATRMVARRLAARIGASRRTRERAIGNSSFADYSPVRRLFRMNDPDGTLHGAKYDQLPPTLQEFYTICVQSMGGRMRLHNQAVMARLMESFSNDGNGSMMQQRRIQGNDPQFQNSEKALSAPE